MIQELVWTKSLDQQFNRKPGVSVLINDCWSMVGLKLFGKPMGTGAFSQALCVTIALLCAREFAREVRDPVEYYPRLSEPQEQSEQSSPCCWQRDLNVFAREELSLKVMKEFKEWAVSSPKSLFVAALSDCSHTDSQTHIGDVLHLLSTSVKSDTFPDQRHTLAGAFEAQDH